MMMEERGLSAGHTTIMRWIHQYATEIKKRFKQLLSNNHCFVPRVMNFGKNAAYPPAFKTIKHNGLIPEVTELRASTSQVSQ